MDLPPSSSPPNGARQLPDIQLQSRDHRDLLDTIDKLRLQGIGKYIDLPQIIVCGDQSSGKSSVLEAISGLTFPTKDALCTRFATELILRRNPVNNIDVCIIPSPDRSDNEKKDLSTFHRTLSQMDLGTIVDEAKDKMGISAHKVFSTDILRIEVSGPTQPHLTMVDLPGLFMAGNKDQSAEDAALVKSLVHSYMKKPRSIILTVVSAKSDFALQQVTELARKIDPSGLRTLGIITKPDTLDRGSESERLYVQLAQNKDVVFQLGWHVLRNRDYTTRNVSNDERDEMEAAFFAEGAWVALRPSQMGVAALRTRLSNVLRDQILKQLPNVLEDVESGLAECRATLEKLGDARGTVQEQKLYLLKISEGFTAIVRDAVDGTYTNNIFQIDESGGYELRLRAVVQNTLRGFATKMAREGEEVVITDKPTEWQAERCMDREEYLDHVAVRMERSRGRELPGSFNPLIVIELFREQCKPWKGIVHNYAERVFSSAQAAVKAAARNAADKETADALFRVLLGPSLDKLKQDMNKKIADILESHLSGHPITYNHYFTLTIQKIRADRQQAELKKLVEARFGVGYVKLDLKQVMDAIAVKTEPDMDRYACIEVTDMMQSYYKVALKTVIDNVAQLAIEAALISKLPGLLPSSVIFGLDDATVRRIAAESEEAALERAQAQKKLEILAAGLRELERLKQLCPTGTDDDEVVSVISDPDADALLEVVDEEPVDERSVASRPMTPRADALEAYEELPAVASLPVASMAAASLPVASVAVAPPAVASMAWTFPTAESGDTFNFGASSKTKKKKKGLIAE